MITTIMVEHAGKTTVTHTLVFDWAQHPRPGLKSGMDRGVAASYNRLVQILALDSAGAAKAPP